MTRQIALLVFPAAVLAACDAASTDDVATASADSLLATGMTAEALEARVAQFEPASIDFDAAALEPWERDVLAKLVQATDIMHEIFARQATPGYDEWERRLAAYDGPGAAAARAYFDIMVGPWDRLEHNEPFLAAAPKPEGAAYYPEDATREEIEAYLAGHPDAKDAVTGYFTVLRRAGDSLAVVPYSEAYRDRLERAATLLREAADLSRNASLSDYLRKRADAFLSNDYLASDLAWMDLDSRIEPTIGPYEVYEDALFGYKAAFEGFVTVSDSAASNELQRLKNHLPMLEDSLPIDDRYKNPNRAFESPIRVVDEVYTGGDTRAGVQTTAFNLPNDVRVHEQKGSKKVMLRNVAQAKFDAILSPIADAVLAPGLAAEIAFQPWFTNVVMHELAHGLGPTTVLRESGERTSVNQALREHYSALEEAKADVTGLHNLTVLAGQGEYDADFVRRAFIGHIADLFRAVRFGAGEAHGKANLVQFNYLMERGALTWDEATGRFDADLEAVVAANRDLARDILTMQAIGAYDATGEFFQRYTVMRPEMEAALARLEDVPVDIRPRYTVKEKVGS
jgi:Peptidase family M49